MIGQSKNADLLAKKKIQILILTAMTLIMVAVAINQRRKHIKVLQKMGTVECLSRLLEIYLRD